MSSSSQIEFPEIARVSRLDFLISDSGIKTYSPHKGSKESKVNHALRGIARDSGNTVTYLNNRVREWLSAQIIEQFLPASRTTLSSLVNDIRYGVDIILTHNGIHHAVDITSNPRVITEKLARRTDQDGKALLVGPDNGITQLPFLVMYITEELVSRIGSEINTLLTRESQKSTNELRELFEKEVHYYMSEKGKYIPQDTIICPYGKDRDSIKNSLTHSFSKYLKEE